MMDNVKEVVDSKEDANVYEKLICVVKHVNVPMVEYCEHKQRTWLEKTLFQKYHLKTFSDGFQYVQFVLQQKNFSEKSFQAEQNNLKFQHSDTSFVLSLIKFWWRLTSDIQMWSFVKRG